MKLLIKLRQEGITSEIRTQNPIYFFLGVSPGLLCHWRTHPQRLDERIKMEVLTVPKEVNWKISRRKNITTHYKHESKLHPDTSCKFSEGSDLIVVTTAFLPANHSARSSTRLSLSSELLVDLTQQHECCFGPKFGNCSLLSVSPKGTRWLCIRPKPPQHRIQGSINLTQPTPALPSMWVHSDPLSIPVKTVFSSSLDSNQCTSYPPWPASL